MRETKLKRWILGIYIGMVVLLIAMVLVWKLRFYDKVNTEIATTTTALETAKDKALGREQPKVLGLDEQLFEEAKANEKLALARSQVEYFRARFRHLNFDTTSPGALDATWIRYMNEYFSDFGLEARRQLIAAADETGVVINTQIVVSAPPQNPEDLVSPPSGYLKPVTAGSIGVTVEGKLPDILRFFERVNKSAILMSVGNVKLEGVSPNIKATTTITPYLVAAGPSAQLAAPAAPPTTEGATNLDGTPAMPGMTPPATP
jgi:hypothetical protein